ncbi:MAG: NAD(P)H-quinone oxidoreductase [Propionibacteriaceae bacterium]|nr:NAD(P)H-quinone oxidoreductase [Propionibacteriaceae bacterium]
MRAVTTPSFGGPEVLQIGDLPVPVPGPGEVLVRTVAAGVNRADLLQRQGHYPPPKGESEVLGLEASGVIEALGEGVTGFAAGDEVVALLAGGGYAEYFVAPAGQVVVPPKGVSLASAAGLIEVAATVVSNLDVARLSAGETFLVHGGAGGIGSFAIQYAKALGCVVATTAGSQAKLDYVRSLGADIALDYHGDWVGELKEQTRGADVILDIMGAKYLESNVAALKRGGRMVVIGLQGGVKGTLNLGALLSKNGTISATSLRFRPASEKAAICARVRDEVWPLLESGAIRLPHETFVAFDDVRTAHEKLAGGDNIGKIILTL